MRNIFILLVLFILALAPLRESYSFDFFKGLSSQEEKKEDKKPIGSIIPGKASYTREAILGNILKGALETMHFGTKKINDDLSKNAFKEYIKRLDYGKQFLLESDIEELKKYEEKLDNEMLSGQLELIDASKKIFDKRMKEVKAFVEAKLKEPFDLNKEEFIETDSDKREFKESMDELKDFWRKLLKYDVLNRYAELEDEQNGVVSEEDKKKKKKKVAKKEKKKKLSPKELEAEARKKVAKSYERIFKRLNREKRIDWLDRFYNSITKVFDPHTNYLPPEEKEDFDIDMSGKLEGIGALLREDVSYIKVERIIPGSASWKGKELEAEDVILKVAQGEKEPVDIVDMPLRDAVKLIRGKKGTEVRLTVKKPSGMTKVISIVRDVVEIEESYAKSAIINFKDEKQKFGYIFVPKFYRDFQNRNGRNCTDDVRAEIQKLKKSNIEGLILDLRNNGGGALDDARMMSGLFIKEGPIVQVKDHRGDIDILADTDDSVEFDKPLIVLLNRFSASASEIVAAALQDYGRAVIVGGEHSHGKGTVQAVMDLNAYLSPVIRPSTSLGALKITIQQFFRINGSSTQYKGVTPDIVLPDQFSYMESGEKYLDYSLPWAKLDEVDYKAWDKYKYDISSLRDKSESRVAKSAKFKKVKDSVAFYKARKDESKRELTLKGFEKERKFLKDKVEEFKQTDINEKVEVTGTDRKSVV